MGSHFHYERLHFALASRSVFGNPVTVSSPTILPISLPNLKTGNAAEIKLKINELESLRHFCHQKYSDVSAVAEENRKKYS